MTDVHDERAALLRRFLRDQRRRAGLSQEDLAELTRYALTTVRDLEAGRLAHPSSELLEVVAAVLGMSPPERKFLWYAATGAHPPVTADCHRVWSDDPALNRMIEEAYPDPAFLLDPAFGVAAYNRAVAEWLVDFGRHPEFGNNIATWMFTDPHARHVLPDWRHEVTPGVIGLIRANHARFPDDPYMNDLISKLCERSAWARELWQEDARVFEWPQTRRLRPPGRTDPEQPDDERQWATVNTVFLNPPAAGDERLLVTFLLPNEHRVQRNLVSEHACAACARARAAASPGAA
ncbi:MAG: helix-turn-helix transcriptional regulator [Micromonosporaceae bacterium]